LNITIRTDFINMPSYRYPVASAGLPASRAWRNADHPGCSTDVHSSIMTSIFVTDGPLLQHDYGEVIAR